MSDKPVYFPVNLVWTGGKSGEIIIGGKAKIRTGTSKSSDAEATFHSPEELFVASAAVCYMNGFVNFIDRMHLEFKAFDCDAVGILEKVDRSYEITKIEMKTRVEIESDEKRGRISRALELAAKYCFVGNSMKCPIEHQTEIVVV
jgi:organic hydroperoxide reductase OsmC/OhrA